MKAESGRRKAEYGPNGAGHLPVQLPLLSEDELRRAGAGSPDRIPELTHYRDEGCRFWHACLTCPFPRCVFEEPGGPARALRAWRDREVRRHFARGEPVDAIAKRFGITRRSVYRIVGGSRQSAVGSGEKTNSPTAHCPLPTARRPKGGPHA